MDNGSSYFLTLFFLTDNGEMKPSILAEERKHNYLKKHDLILPFSNKKFLR